MNSIPTDMLLPIVQDTDGVSAAYKTTNLNSTLFIYQNGGYRETEYQPNFTGNVAESNTYAQISLQTTLTWEDVSQDLYVFSGYAGFVDRFIDLTKPIILKGKVDYVDNTGTTQTAMLGNENLVFYCNGWLVHIPPSFIPNMNNIVLECTLSYGITWNKEDTLEIYCINTTTSTTTTASLASKRTSVARFMREMRFLKSTRQICKTCEFTSF